MEKSFSLKNFKNLKRDVISIILEFCNYSDFSKFIFINKHFLESLQYFIKNKVNIILMFRVKETKI